MQIQLNRPVAISTPSQFIELANALYEPLVKQFSCKPLILDVNRFPSAEDLRWIDLTYYHLINYLNVTVFAVRNEIVEMEALDDVNDTLRILHSLCFVLSSSKDAKTVLAGMLVTADDITPMIEAVRASVSTLKNVHTIQTRLNDLKESLNTKIIHKIILPIHAFHILSESIIPLSQPTIQPSAEVVTV